MAPVIEKPGTAPPIALLLAAHGERRPDAGNEGAFQLARALASRSLVAEVAIGFISGTPGISEALETLTARRILVYPLFASSGYFTRDRLVQLLDEAKGDGRSIDMLPPLGLDPGLPDLLCDQAVACARDHGYAPEACTFVLLAHGSKRNPASRQATEQVAREIETRAACREVVVAFLEEQPSLEEAAQSIHGPAIVLGLFSGEGLHGAKDAPKLVARLGRPEVVFAGIMGSGPGIEDLVARAVVAALRDAGATEAAKPSALAPGGSAVSVD
ncbi:CbiX/SirB N-terminal domain-containing protein [Bradyrhizobium sp. U531]|uniref:CbiX/SirB N-terminal domain-containing protein n=1 Tax=Bradyrhizobium sp. U531 TaxID=3053458 RepID=UPI003F43580B